MLCFIFLSYASEILIFSFFAHNLSDSLCLLISNKSRFALLNQSFKARYWPSSLISGFCQANWLAIFLSMKKLKYGGFGFCWSVEDRPSKNSFESLTSELFLFKILEACDVRFVQLSDMASTLSSYIKNWQEAVLHLNELLIVDRLIDDYPQLHRLPLKLSLESFF